MHFIAFLLTLFRKALFRGRNLSACVFVFFAFLLLPAAHALEPLPLPDGVAALDLTHAVEYRREAGESIQVSTAPGPDGIVRRIEVRARGSEEKPTWIVFALTNKSEEQRDRLLVAPHFRLAGSGLLRPDLGAARLVAVTPSQGFAPERQPSADSDVFLLTLDPGAVVTFVAEVRTPDLPQLTLWEPNAYKDNINAYTLYRGIVLGIAGLLALVLTILFVVKGSLMFPATAALAWAVLAYITVDFGFLNKIFRLESGFDQLYRASSEVMIAVTLVIFLYAYLNLNRWHVRYSHVLIVTMLALCALFAVALYDPPLAAGIARAVMALLGLFGLLMVLLLSFRGYDRAIMLIPTWLLFIGWMIGMGMTVSGRLDNDMVQPALSGGLVLLVLLFGFTVMQHAFTGGAIAEGLMSDTERRALALTGSGDMVWDWDVARDKIFTSLEVEESLGLKRGTLEGPARDWLDVLHPQDRPAFKACLDAIVETRRGRLVQSFRLHASNGDYHWFRLKARPILGNDGEVIRCVGTLVNVTDAKMTEERLLHDAIHDHLTGLPNRELFLDRLSAAMVRADSDPEVRPAVFLVDIDRFRQINESLGRAVGDSILLTIARRLGHVLKPLDTLSRIEGDRFALIVLSAREADQVAALADAVRRTIRGAIVFGEQEIFLTASIGIAMVDRDLRDPLDVLKDAEIAASFAKRLGGDRIDTFRPSLQVMATDRLTLENDLPRALEREEMQLMYQPIMHLAGRTLAGFEVLLRWEHPKRGRIFPKDFIPIAERSGAIIPIGLYVLERAARQRAEWQEKFPEAKALFVSVNISSRQLLRHDLIHDVKTVLEQSPLPKGALKLELTESLLMENPEFATKVLTRLKELGVGLALDDFGTGFSSLGYLHHLPAETLKIDQSFLKGQGKNRPIVLGAMIKLAHELGMDVVAEGVESETEAKELERLGADCGQGYLFGQAVPAVDVPKILEKSFKARGGRAKEKASAS